MMTHSNNVYLNCLSADSQCGLYSARRDRWNGSSGVRPEEALRGRVSEENGRIVRMCFVYSLVGQVCGSGGRSSRQVSTFNLVGAWLDGD